MSDLTPRQQECVIFIESEVKAHGVTPSYAQIGAALGIKSKHGVSNLIDLLIRARVIRRTPKIARGIELLVTENHHATDCICLVCSNARYLRGLKLIHALEVPPPAWLVSKLKGLRPLRLAKISAKFRAQSSQFHDGPQSSRRHLGGDS